MRKVVLTSVVLTSVMFLTKIAMAATWPEPVDGWQEPTGGWEDSYIPPAGGTLPHNVPSDLSGWSDDKYWVGTGEAVGASYVTNVVEEGTVLRMNNATDGWSDYALYFTDGTDGRGEGSSNDLITVDMRFALLDVQSEDQFFVRVTRPDSTVGQYKDFYLRFNNDYIRAYVSDTEPLYDQATTNLSTNYHDFRILIDVADNTMRVYVDGNGQALLTTTGRVRSGNDNQISMGDGSGSIGGRVNLSSLKWINTELLEVIPQGTLLIIK